MANLKRRGYMHWQWRQQQELQNLGNWSCIDACVFLCWLWAGFKLCLSRLLADECVLSRVSYYSESPMFETCKEWCFIAKLV